MWCSVSRCRCFCLPCWRPYESQPLWDFSAAMSYEAFHCLTCEVLYVALSTHTHKRTLAHTRAHTHTHTHTQGLLCLFVFRFHNWSCSKRAAPSGDEWLHMGINAAPYRLNCCQEKKDSCSVHDVYCYMYKSTGKWDDSWGTTGDVNNFTPINKHKFYLDRILLCLNTLWMSLRSNIHVWCISKAFTFVSLFIC